jgi:glycerophosphoryl diester phosphodiesterase
MVVSHRGRTTLGEAPDNTLAAFAEAIVLGAEMIEFDVRRTQDGRLILNHDPDIQGRLIADMTYQQLMNWEGGRHVALLEEAIELTAGHVFLDVEIKEAGFEKDVLDVMRRRYDVSGFVVTSFRDEVVARVKELDTGVCVGLLVGENSFKELLRSPVGDLFPLMRLRRTRADFLACSCPLADLGVLNQAAAAGVPVVVWTVNDRRRLKRHLRDERVVAVITDVPELAFGYVGPYRRTS